MEALKGLAQWIRCLRGDHDWVILEAHAGELFEFCLHCGERA